MEQAPGSPQQQQGLPGCYRHPERETGIRCTRCERPICPECMISASVGFQCPDCVRGGSGTGHAPTANQPRTLAGGTIAGDPHLVTKVIIGICFAMFLAQQAIGDAFTDRLDLIGQAYVPALGSVEGVAEGQWYRLLTSVFLHLDYFHILSNMLSLWFVGRYVEEAFGRIRYTALFVLSGLAGSALSYMVDAPNQPSLGASGAILGVFGALAVLIRRQRYDMRPVIAMLVIMLIVTFGWSNVSWTAHVGGLVGGALIGVAMVHAPRERRALVQYGTCALVLVAVVVMTLLRTAQLT
ncbi:rhomboid family intramembrane serine protease [Streptomyces sp. NPDC090106]|uniref:rhomboid family intramembrane serine protease n=1 Tax=Streptomyces sp. NPDC090106 TaxID=3365946 RepID=UPI003804E202